MASTINASTSSGIVQTADTSGILQLQSNGTTVLTASSTGISFTNASGSVPAFSAYNNGSGTNIAATTWTKVVLNTKDYDTNSNFDNTTNYRFQPTVAGYYLITGNFSQWLPGSPSFLSFFYIYKNGSTYRYNQTAGTGGP